VKSTGTKLIRNSTAEFLIFTGQAGEQSIEARYEDETVWLTQKLMAELFAVDVRTGAFQKYCVRGMRIYPRSFHVTQHPIRLATRKTSTPDCCLPPAIVTRARCLAMA